MRMWRSGHDFFNDFAVNVGEAEVAARVTVGETLVIEAEQMENGGVEIVDVNRIFDCFEAEFVGGPVDCSPFDPTAREPNGKAVRIVIATFCFLTGLA